jgi:molybdate/tungstate transport system permease protein
VSVFLPGVGQTISQLAPVFIYTTYTADGLAEAGAVALVLLAVSAGVFLLVRTLGYDSGVP